MADSVGTLGVDLRTMIKKLGAVEKARKECGVSFSLMKKKKHFKKLHESGCQEAVTCGYDASNDLEESMQWRCRPRRG